jgi:hypothetical protein
MKYGVDKVKCKCGGKLKKIAVDCYECEVCLLKQKVAFATLPTLDVTPKINIGIVGPIGVMGAELLDKIFHEKISIYLSNQKFQSKK